jgi:hypothetical protein
MLIPPVVSDGALVSSTRKVAAAATSPSAFGRPTHAWAWRETGTRKNPAARMTSTGLILDMTAFFLRGVPRERWLLYLHRPCFHVHRAGTVRLTPEARQGSDATEHDRRPRGVR